MNWRRIESREGVFWLESGFDGGYCVVWAENGRRKGQTKRGFSVIIRFFHKEYFIHSSGSSVGQSSGLLNRRSQVRALLGAFFVFANTRADSCRFSFLIHCSRHYYLKPRKIPSASTAFAKSKKSMLAILRLFSIP